jgi:hypothetical protein
MYVWNFTKCENDKPLFKSLFQHKFSHYNLSRFKNIVRNSDMHSHLKQIMLDIVRLIRVDRSNTTINALLECVAFIQYKKDNAVAGEVNRLSSICVGECKKHVCAFLDRWCKDAIKSGMVTQSDFWFHMRVAVMDAFVIAHCITCEDDECIFYGGNSHIQTVYKELVRLGAIVVAIPTDIKVLTLQQLLLTVVCLQFDSKLVILLGEDHSRTRLSFSRNFLDFLQQKCYQKTSITCLVEKHISNQKDFLQRELMCNMPEMAIHNFRCNPFTESNTCSNMHIFPVDNRHFDLGFLRMEVFLPRNKDFERLTLQFNESALQSLKKLIGCIQ